MKHLLAAIMAITALSGCVSAIPIKEQVPTPEYVPSKSVIVAVVDERPQLAEGKPANFIGVAHGAFGIPVDWHVHQVLATEKTDKELTLAQWLENRIVNGLSSKGWQVKAVPFKALPTPVEASDVLKQNQASELMVLVLKDWYFSINLNWVSAFNFDTDTHLHVFEDGAGEVLYKQIKERDVIDEKASESPQNNVLRAYRDQLQQIFADPELRAIAIGEQAPRL
ncbi:MULTISPECIES: hypothetical protein [Shewanella]|uniref:Lipoprotein n=2 Tax=Shewanella TaxID=22 RepID=A0A974XNP0_9GAMM|nr:MULTISPECIES: hypothetical protein [Shewanella]QSX30416.1 hypothetical protein JYB88_01795 [Shewanella cyperi]QSX37629.1 hypothetical protein JYB85_01975 [Shewanella sedimentimangrovi]QSX41188.1 hypothetical protein JYB84_01790 [Shewanella cyperi]